MEHNKSRVSFQLNILQFLPKKWDRKGSKELIINIQQNPRCLLVLFMSLSKKLVDNWLPELIQKHKNKMLVTNPSLSNEVKPYVDGEVSMIVGWDLLATINKY